MVSLVLNSPQSTPLQPMSLQGNHRHSISLASNLVQGWAGLSWFGPKRDARGGLLRASGKEASSVLGEASPHLIDMNKGGWGASYYL